MEKWDLDDAPKLHLDLGSHRAACDGTELDPKREATDHDCRKMKPCQICQLLQAHLLKEGLLQ